MKREITTFGSEVAQEWVEVTGYIDLRLRVDVIPDQNNNCWISLDRAFRSVTETFDITANEVDNLISALTEWKENHAKLKENIDG